MLIDWATYHTSLAASDLVICEALASVINTELPEAEHKIWHAHPVWFLKGNPVVGYSTLKHCVRLLFWSGQSFTTPGLVPEGKFKAAEVRYTEQAQIDVALVAAWLREARTIQWDYKNLVRRKGKLERLV